jgi:hypothetical protein
MKSNGTWDDGYPSGGNYWSDYRHTDMLSGPGQNLSGSDGIGDVSYIIDGDNIDAYPLMAPVSFYDSDVSIISNSSISLYELTVARRTLSFNVTGSDLTTGFCRVTIPNSVVHNLWRDNLSVQIDGESIPFWNWTDPTDTYIYFTYEHSEHKVMVIAEFSTVMTLSLLTILSTIEAVFIRKRIPRDLGLEYKGS